MRAGQDSNLKRGYVDSHIGLCSVLQRKRKPAELRMLCRGAAGLVVRGFIRGDVGVKPRLSGF
jgi:hypothetical protein